MDATRSETVARARRGLLLFAVLTILGTVGVDANLSRDPSLIFERMWVPGLASLITRAVLREGGADISLRLDWRVLRFVAVAWVFPLVTLTIAYGLAWAASLEPLRPEASAGDVARSLVRSATLGLLPSALSAAGEELGWRGYMLTRFIDAGVPYPIGVSGLVWWAWHLPLVLRGELLAGPSPLVAVLLFFPTVMALAIVAGVVRCDSGSVWPAVMLHASFNAAMDLTFDPLTAPRPGGQLWTGASGVAVCIICSVGAATIWKARASFSNLHGRPARPLGTASSSAAARSSLAASRSATKRPSVRTRS